MKASMILALIAAVALAGVPATDLGQQNQVKLYYGTVGSNDYILGTGGPSSSTDAWAQHSLMPQMLMDNAACATATNAYVVSGYNASHPKYLFSHATGGTTWSTLAAPPIEISNGGIAAVGDTLYYCSGYSYGTSTTMDTLMKYSITGNSWTTAPGPFTGTTYNWQPLILAAGGKVFYISGCNAPGATAPSLQTWAYTPGAGWAQMANMNTGAVFMAGWVYNDTIWVAGGNKDNIGITRTEFYDVANDTWIINNSVFPQLPEALWGVASGCVEAAATGYVAGGVTSAGALTDTVYYFDHAAHTWSVGGELVQRVYRGAGAGNADGKAVIYGGSTGGFTPTNVCQYDQLLTGNATDVGVSGIIAPAMNITPGAVAPKALIKNFGTEAQSNIPVTCWIDSGATRIYNQTTTYAGPLAPNGTAEVTFSPVWNANVGTYGVTMFTNLSGDQQRANDTTKQTTIVFASNWESIPGPADSIDRLVHITVYAPTNDKIYMIGGNSAGQTGTYRGMCQEFNPATNVWTNKAPMPTPLGWMAPAYVKGKVYAICGHNNAGTLENTNQQYDPVANTWATKLARPGTAAAAASGAVWRDSLIYVMGGLASAGLTNVDVYNPTSNTWATGTALPQACYMGSATCIGDTIYIAQAYNGSSCWSNFYKGAINPANPTQIAWTQGPALSEPVFNGATVATDNEVYWIGGFINAATPTNHVWKYSRLTGAITAFAPSYSINNTRVDYACTRYGTDGWWIYVMAGDMNGDWVTPNRTYRKLNLGGTGVEEGKTVQLARIESVRPTLVTDRAVISYSVPQSARVQLGVYDVAGKLVRTLVSGTVAGNQTAVWNRTDNSGARVAAGTYFYRLSVDGRSVSSKSVLLD